MIKNAQGLKALFNKDRANYKQVLNRAVKEGEVDFRNISLQDICREFIHPYEYTDVLMQDQLPELVRRSEGSTVNPSVFQDISGFDPTVAAMLAPIVMEGFNAADRMGDEFVETVSGVRYQGGKWILPLIGQDEGEGLELTQKYPASMLDEYYVSKPTWKKNGNNIKISKFDYIQDLTGKIQEVAYSIGQRIAWLKEKKIALCVMGIVNPLVINDVALNTYQASATSTLSDQGLNVGKWINQFTVASLATAAGDSAANNVSTVAQLAQFTVDMEKNTVPGQDDIPISLGKTPTWLVSPQYEFNANQIVTMGSVFSGNAAFASATKFYEGGVGSKETFSRAIRVKSSRYWYNLLVNAAYGNRTDDATHAQAVSFIGDFPRAFKYLEVLPMSVIPALITFELQNEDVATAFVCSEVGVCATQKPYYAGMIYNTAG